MGQHRADIDPVRVFYEIAELERVYPGFRSWYFEKVVPGIETGHRLLLADVTDQGVAGVVIAKRTADELKLCSVWRSRFLGSSMTSSMLVRSAMDWLGTDRPVFTIPSDRISRLKPLMNEIGASEGRVLGDLYRRGIDELLFNAREMPR